MAVTKVSILPKKLNASQTSSLFLTDKFRKVTSGTQGAL